METATKNMGRTLSAQATRQILDEFYREGSVIVPGVLDAAQCQELRDCIDATFARVTPDQIYAKFVLREIANKDVLFRNLLVSEPVYGLAKAIIGDDCRYCGSSAIRTGLDEAISRWHIDLYNVVEFPLPPEVPRHDPRIRMPVQWMTFQIALTDIETLEDGPTQFVPASHYSGRVPNSQENPEFEGRSPVSLFCKAGDMYLTNHQVWHRGAPNTSGRTRYLLQLQYGANWAAMRFNGDAANDVATQINSDNTPKETTQALQKLLRS